MNHIVNTPCGPVRGYPGRVPGTLAFKGIRYATAGRWEYPRQVTGWEGVYDATAYGHCQAVPKLSCKAKMVSNNAVPDSSN